MAAHSPKMKRAAGTRSGWAVIRAGFRRPKAAARSSDVAAVDRGEGRRVACLFRGLYPPYSAQFRFRMLDLTADAVILRPPWFSPDRRPIRITETATAAYLRPRDPATDHRIRSYGNYRAGKPLEFAGFTVVVCETARGKLEFAVPNPDVSLILHYFHRGAGEGERGAAPSQAPPRG